MSVISGHHGMCLHLAEGAALFRPTCSALAILLALVLGVVIKVGILGNDKSSLLHVPAILPAVSGLATASENVVILDAPHYEKYRISAFNPAPFIVAKTGLNNIRKASVFRDCHSWCDLVFRAGELQQSPWKRLIRWNWSRVSTNLPNDGGRFSAIPKVNRNVPWRISAWGMYWPVAIAEDRKSTRLNSSHS